jgi:hypothetical protein
MGFVLTIIEITATINYAQWCETLNINILKLSRAMPNVFFVAIPDINDSVKIAEVIEK